MNKFKKIIPIGLLALGLVFSCSKDGGGTGNDIVDPPTASILMFPENNKECNEGIVVSATETDVLFQWEAATNASSYILNITNLNEGTSRNISTNSTELSIRILRGTPYSWSVESLVSGTNETAESTVWKFYNAGLPEESHPPFPAEAVSPQMSSSIDEGTINLQWLATDIDNDIASYTILLDPTSPPITQVGFTSVNNISVAVNSGFNYYWKVITTDALGNASDSQIFQFIVN